MPVDAPKIDSRDQTMLVEQLQKLALKYCSSEYLPEAWKDISSIQSDKQANTLIHIFSRMLETIIYRLNKIPDKNFLTFLDLIGVRLSQARVARTPLTFTMASGASLYALIPAGTQVATAEATGQEVVVFETEKSLTVILPKLAKAVSLSPADDMWTDHSFILFDKKGESSEELFKGKELVPHRICLAHKKLFGFKEKTTIVLHVELKDDKDEINLPDDVQWKLKWYYYGKDSPDQIPLIATGYITDPTKPNPVVDTSQKVVNLLKKGYIKFSDVSGIVEKTIQGFEDKTDLLKSWSGYWIFAELISPIQKLLPEISTLKASVLVALSSSQGEGTISSENPIVTGDSTAFKDELQVGECIIAADQKRSITKINSDTSLTVDSAFNPQLPNGTKFIRTLQKGKGTISSIGTNVTGVETDFANEFKKDDYIVAADQRRCISSVDTNTSLTVDQAFSPQLDEKTPYSYLCLLEGTGTISSPVIMIGNGTDFTKKLEKGDSITAENQTRIITSVNTDTSLEVNFAFDPKLSAETAFTYTSPLLPDAAFQNNFKLDLTKDFFPFGEKPKFNDTFYIGSKEVFSKEGAEITIMIALSEGIVPNTTNVKLFWESWDGNRKNWTKIGETNQDGTVNPAGFTDTTNAFLQNGQVRFKCPAIEAAEINGEENYWVRIRILGGNYGEEATYIETTIQTTEGSSKVWTYNPSTFKPPSISILALSYIFLPDEEDLEAVLTYNDFVYEDQTEIIQKNETFKPFKMIEDTKPALYLAFDQDISTLPVTIFFPLIGKAIGTIQTPLIGTGTISSDNTTLTGTGTNFAKIINVGYSIVAAGQKRTVTSINSDSSLTVDSSFDPPLLTGTRFSYIPSYKEAQDSSILTWQYWTGKDWEKLKVEDNTNNLTKRELIQFLAPADVTKRYCFGFESGYYWIRVTLEQGRMYENFPTLKAIHTNTVWAHNMVTIKDEILGFSNGKPDQIFKFSQFPVQNGQKVLVRELSLSEEDRKIIFSEEGEDAIEEIIDDAGNIIGLWVRWHEIKNFYFSKPNSRHYTTDLNNGIITFGNGNRGMIPPAGKDNIKCSYQSGGGVKGNVKAGTITKLRTTFPYIDSVTNPEAAAGGSDKESLDRVRERGPQTLKHRDRAVTYEDFEWLVREAAPDVAKVKCLPTRGPNLQVKPGWVTLIVVPESDDPKPLPDQQLVNEIETYLFERTSSYLTTYLSQINLIGPGYIQVRVEASVQFTSITEAKTIEGRILDNLQQFFHPLHGGPEKKGWDFGRNVYISEIFELIENVDGVDHVDDLTIKASIQVNKLKLKESKVLPVSYPKHSTVNFNNDQIVFFLAETLQKEKEIDELYVVGFKEGDQIKVSDNNKNYLSTLSVKSVLDDVLECETDKEVTIPKGSIVETSDGIRSIMSYTTDDSKQIDQSKIIRLTIATFFTDIFSGAEVVLYHRDDPVSEHLKIDKTDYRVETIFIDENYLVYSGTHTINK